MAENKRGRKPGSQAKRRRARRQKNELDKEEVKSLVCRLFSEGHPPARIEKLMLQRFGQKISREAPWAILSEAVAERQFQFVPAIHKQLENELRERCPWLATVCVARTASSFDMGRRTAETMADLINELRRSRKLERVTVGLAGGYLLSRTTREFASLYADPHRLDEGKLTLQSLVGGIDTQRVGFRVSPNMFSQYFIDNPDIPGSLLDQLDFIHLNAPAMVTQDEYRLLSERMEYFQHMREQAEQNVALIVTSAGHWRFQVHEHPQEKPGHSDLCQMYFHRLRQDHAEQFERLYDVEGDILWTPLAAKLRNIDPGPIIDGDADAETDLFPLLHELPVRPVLALDPRVLLPGRYQRTGRRILLAMSLCGQCREPKIEPLRILTRFRMATDLVIDSRTARTLIDEIDRERSS